MTMIKKLTSRKLWLAIAGVATGIAVALGANSGDVQTISTAVQTGIGCITALISAVTYIKTEGKIDAASVEKAGTAVQQATEAAQSVVDTLNGSVTDDTESGGSYENAE